MFKRTSLMMMLVFVLGLSFISSAYSFGPKEKRFGLGVIVGDPTGLSGKFYLTKKFSVDGFLSWSFVDDAFVLGGDVLYDLIDIGALPAVNIPFYLGAGLYGGWDGGGANDDESVLGVRFPVGVAIQLKKFPLEIFGELAPAIQLSPDSDFDLMGGIGLRFYFF